MIFLVPQHETSDAERKTGGWTRLCFTEGERQVFIQERIRKRDHRLSLSDGGSLRTAASISAKMPQTLQAPASASAASDSEPAGEAGAVGACAPLQVLRLLTQQPRHSCLSARVVGSRSC